MAVFHSILWLIFHCVSVSLLLYPFICWWTFRLLLCLINVNSATMNFMVHVSFQIRDFSRCMLRSGIAELYGSSIFRFLRSLHTVLNSGCINLHSYQQCKVSFSLHHLQHLLFVDTLIMASLTSVKGYLIVVLICVSLVLSIFHASIGHVYVSFGEMSF